MPKQKCILIVEDDRSLRGVLSDKLTDEGFRVLAAEDGKTGLEVALKEHPDCILLDIFMPVMDGVTMLMHLRHSDPWGKHVSVLVLTNSSDANTLAKVTDLGATDFLIKSEWPLEGLVGKIRERISTLSQ